MPSTKLDDQIRVLDAKIEDTHKEQKQAWADFAKLRTELNTAAGNGDIDIGDTDSEPFKAAMAANGRQGELADKVNDLKEARSQLHAMMPEGNGRMIENGSPAARGLRERVKDGAHSRYTPAAQLLARQEYRQAVESGVFHSAGDKLGQRVQFGELFDAEAFADLISPARQASVVVTTEDAESTVRPFIIPQQLGLYPQPMMPLFLRNLITVGVTTTDSLEYVLETGFVNRAARVPEASTASPITGGVTAVQAGLKPQSTLTFEKKSQPVETFAHWVAATKKSLADAPRLQTYIDQKLRRGLDELLERIIAAGDPDTDGVAGVMSTPGVQWQNSSSGVFFENILKGMTKVMLAYFTVTATALNPLDWEDIRLSRDASGAGAGTGGYLFGPPSQAGATTLWGQSVSIGAQMPEGTAITGDWRAVELYIREGVNVVASDSHADFFVRNLIALLAEFRAALVIPQPEALCEISTSQPS